MARDWTLDMESRIVKLEHDLSQVEKVFDGDTKDSEIYRLRHEAGQYRRETLEVEKKYEILLEAMREITKLAEKIHSGSELAASMNTVAMYALDAVRDKPSDAPSEAKIDEKDSEIWRLQTELLKENNEHLLCQRRYEIARRQLDIARAALQAISHDEKRAGWNLDNSPATQAVQKLAGTLIPDSC